MGRVARPDIWKPSSVGLKVWFHHYHILQIRKPGLSKVWILPQSQLVDSAEIQTQVSLTLKPQLLSASDKNRWFLGGAVDPGPHLDSHCL
jgi:hypothetical protein